MVSSPSKFNPPENQTLFCVTIPRSGHHLLEKWMDVYFDGQLSHVGHSRYERLKNPIRKLKNHHLVLNHDFGLRKPWPESWYYAFPKRTDLRYLIQFRNPLLSTISDYYLYAERTLQRSPNQKDWESFGLKAILYRKKFIEKWLFNPLLPHQKNLSFETVALDPAGNLFDILHFAFPSIEIDKEKVEQTVRDFPFRPFRKLRDFEFYDSVYFRKLIKQLGRAGEFLISTQEFNIDFDLP
ncbi:hypothetical protein MLD52_13620 [Puniceicoccaceae bacterium K14]|nr:hypothetical protein [Puniceicoccaceae bacterium K14]